MEYIILVISLVGIVIGANSLVTGAVSVAKRLEVSDFVIGAAIVGVGTSIPEFAASIAVAVKKNTGLALGNIIGSNIFNISFILGISSQVMPLTSLGITLTDYVVMIIAALLPLVLGLRGNIGRISGIFMFICYITYNCYLVNNQIH